VDIAWLQEPPREKGGIGISYSAYKMTTRKRDHKAIQRESNLVVHEQNDLSKGVNDDVIATEVRRIGEMIRKIVNVYDKRNRQSKERSVRKLKWQRVIRQDSTVRRWRLYLMYHPMAPKMPRAAECCILGRRD
jgi:hypothetical protein